MVVLANIWSRMRSHNNKSMLSSLMVPSTFPSKCCKDGKCSSLSLNPRPWRTHKCRCFRCPIYIGLHNSTSLSLKLKCFNRVNLTKSVTFATPCIKKPCLTSSWDLRLRNITQIGIRTRNRSPRAKANWIVARPPDNKSWSSRQTTLRRVRKRSPRPRKT